MSELARIWLQRTLTSVTVTPVTPPSASIRFAQIRASSIHKIIGEQVYRVDVNQLLQPWSVILSVAKDLMALMRLLRDASADASV